jgi:glycosyltransferase involved in cell wall biosynthesis
MNQRPTISVVVPLYNEAENIELLHQSLTRVLCALESPFEMLFVDDGSEDETFWTASVIASCDPRLRIIKLRKNFGQTPAFAAGIDHARGEIIITMDGDLQNDPADIPKLLEKMDEGFDVVVGWRHCRRDALITRKIPSMLANWIIGKVTGIPIHDNGCSLKAFRGEVARNMPLYSDLHRFMPVAASASGARIAEIKVAHHPRRFGKSKYGLSRIYKVALDLIATKTITSFALRPLHWFSALAMPFGLLGAAILFYGVGVIAWQGKSLTPIVSVGLLFFMLAMVLVLTGVLAELVSHTADKGKSRLPAFSVHRIAGGRDDPDTGGS